MNKQKKKKWQTVKLKDILRKNSNRYHPIKLEYIGETAKLGDLDVFPLGVPLKLEKGSPDPSKERKFKIE